MNLIFQLRLNNIDGVLERVLGVIRYRNFQVLRMMAAPTPDGSRMDVTLKVGGLRKTGHLARHLEKLLDVETLEVYSEMKKVSFG